MCPLTRPFPHILHDCENRKELLDYEISFCECWKKEKNIAQELDKVT